MHQSRWIEFESCLCWRLNMNRHDMKSRHWEFTIKIVTPVERYSMCICEKNNFRSALVFQNWKMSWMCDKQLPYFSFILDATFLTTIIFSSPLSITYRYSKCAQIYWLNLFSLIFFSHWTLTIAICKYFGIENLTKKKKICRSNWNKNDYSLSPMWLLFVKNITV